MTTRLRNRSPPAYRSPSPPPGVNTRRSWRFRTRPPAPHKPFTEGLQLRLPGGPFNDIHPPPNQLRWSPFPIPAEPTDFVDGLITLAGNGDPAAQTGVA